MEKKTIPEEMVFRPSKRREEPIVDLQPFALPSSFWLPEFMNDTAGCQHAPFLFWLTEAIRPRALVNIGRGRGTTYFSFCQAVRDLSLDSRLVWFMPPDDGDRGGGQPGGDAREVISHNDEHFSGCSRVVLSDPVQQAASFQDGSVDVIGVDLTSGEIDLEGILAAWQGKLSDRGVVVVHGSNRPEDPSGLAKACQDLRDSHPSFEFLHGEGLTLVGIGETPQILVELLFDLRQRKTQYLAVRRMFWRLGQACLALYKLKDAERKIQWLYKKKEGLDEALALQSELLEQLRLGIKQARRSLSDRGRVSR